MFIFHLMYHIENIEATRLRYMRTRPILHEAENEAEAKTYEAEPEAKATKFGLEAGLNIPACYTSFFSSACLS